MDKEVLIPIRNTVYSQEEVEAYFQQYGYTVTSQYVNAHSLIEYICPEGHVGKMTRANFLTGYRCPKCKSIKQGNRCRFTFEYVQNYFREHGCEP